MYKREYDTLKMQNGQIDRFGCSSVNDELKEDADSKATELLFA